MPLWVVAALAALTVVVLSGTQSGFEADAVYGNVGTVGVDMDGTGNQPRTKVGVDTTREACATVATGGAITVDVYADGIPADRGLAGFEYTLKFNAGLVEVTSIDHEQLIVQAPGSNAMSFGEPQSSTGSVLTAVVDFGKGIEPAGPSETGPGILTRITLVGKGSSGTGDISLQGVKVFGDNGAQIPVGSVVNGKVAVNTPCGSGTDAGKSPDKDLNCDGKVDPKDALVLLQKVTGNGMKSTPEGCPKVGDAVEVSGVGQLWGDVNCDGQVNATDALLLLRSVAKLPVNLSQCGSG